MAAYIVSIIRVLDRDRLADWRKSVKPTAANFGGVELARGSTAAIVEGNGDATDESVAVVRFPNEAAVREMLASADYVAGKAAREGIVSIIQRIVIDAEG